jgi:hypothetical protein
MNFTGMHCLRWSRLQLERRPGHFGRVLQGIDAQLERFKMCGKPI